MEAQDLLADEQGVVVDDVHGSGQPKVHSVRAPEVPKKILLAFPPHPRVPIGEIGIFGKQHVPLDAAQVGGLARAHREGLPVRAVLADGDDPGPRRDGVPLGGLRRRVRALCRRVGVHLRRSMGGPHRRLGLLGRGRIRRRVGIPCATELAEVRARIPDPAASPADRSPEHGRCGML